MKSLRTTSVNRPARPEKKARERQLRSAIQDAAASAGFSRKALARHLLRYASEILDIPEDVDPRTLLGAGKPRSETDKGPERRSIRASGKGQEPPGKGKLKFRGTIQHLRQLTWFAQVRGDWERKPNNVWRFVCRNGAGMNWSSTKGTLWFDGPEVEELRRAVKRALDDWVYVGRRGEG